MKFLEEASKYYERLVGKGCGLGEDNRIDNRMPELLCAEDEMDAIIISCPYCLGVEDPMGDG